ncbi:MAG: ABC transporter permease [Candidatus Izemoplasmatales bacterium]|jgi:oligopeptide transport system permease protein|nr:ABC transporter permease [Candidatus Izemoplasmatales bacterium]MDD3865419.1 ABC transporter permease [Candidatus Izemoplasmatales bacterium]
MENIAKEKFILVQQDEVLYDERIKTKSIGYYKDAFLRFKKNKASVIAAIILIFLIIMAIVGPFLSSYNLFDVNAKWSARLNDMPPKIEGLEWLGFNGEKQLTGYPENFSNIPNGIVLRITGRNNIGQITVVVDYYAYINYIYSCEIDTATQDFTTSSYTNLTISEYEAVRAAEAATGDTIILEDAPLVAGSYLVRVDYYKFLYHIYDVQEPAFWFGSDPQGRDLFTELWKGARLSLLIAFSVALINILVGIIWGSISGYFGGTVDLVMERISDILAGLPFMAILTLLLLRYGNSPGVVIVAFTLTGWLGIASLTRAQFYRYKNREYVLAARTLGASDSRIIIRHIFPNAVGTLITSLVLYIPAVIFSESTFSFLGIINYAENTSVGRLLSTGQSVMKESFYQVLFPSVFISLLMLSFNLFGNGLRDAFNPSLRGVEE